MTDDKFPGREVALVCFSFIIGHLSFVICHWKPLRIDRDSHSPRRAGRRGDRNAAMTATSEDPSPVTSTPPSVRASIEAGRGVRPEIKAGPIASKAHGAPAARTNRRSAPGPE